MRKKYAEKMYAPTGTRTHDTCGLIDKSANHYATESAASMENY